MGEPSLLVGNHSGGLMIADTFVFSAAFYDHFGPDQRFHQLAHDVAAKSPLLGLIRRYGVVPASHDNARAAFDLGAPVLVYPGGDYETFRPELARRPDRVRRPPGLRQLALERDVPIVPVVAIGGQETALFVTRGQRAAKLIGLDKLTRIKVLPVSIGPPLGINLLDFPGRIPLPAKIKIQVLPPIDLRERYGADPTPTRPTRRSPARCRTRSARWARSGRCPSSADRRHPDVDREPEHEEGEHGWKAATHGASSRAPTSMIWTVISTSSPKLMPIARRVRGPISARMNSRIAAVWIIQPKPSCASKLSAPKMPSPARNTCTTMPTAIRRASQ